MRLALDPASILWRLTRLHPGRRQEFSIDDDLQLVAYLARHAPDKAKSGRLGNKLYKDLCDDVGLDALAC